MQLPRVFKPFQCMTMGNVSPLLRTSQCHQYLLVVFNYAMCYLKAIPVRTVTAPSIAKKLVQMF